MKNKIRKMYISFVVTSCIVFGFLSICIAYENIRKTEYGDYRHAIDLKDGKLYIFDFIIDIKK